MSPSRNISKETYLGHYNIVILVLAALAVLDPNEVTKAETLIEVLTLLYSYPNVQGVNLWGFWDALMYNADAALYTGDDVTVSGI